MTEEPSGYRRQSSSTLPLMMLLLAAIGGLLLVLVFSSMLFCWPFSIGSSCEGESADTGTTDGVTQTDTTNTINSDNGAVPTPFAPSSGTTNGVVAGNLPVEPIEIQVGNGDAVSLTIDAPATIQLGGNTFNIAAQQMDENGFWTPSIETETDAVWLNGTFVNYVVALADTDANRELVELLQRNDEIVMGTSTGVERKFSVSSREILPISNTDVFTQIAPGVTIILVGLGDQYTDRYVVRARYVADESLSTISIDGSTPPNLAPATFGIGELADLGDIAVRVAAFTNKPEPSGTFTYELFDYEIENRGSTPFDTALLEMTLRDLAGNPYVANDEASVQGNFPPIIPQITVGDRLPATVGYKIPVGLERDNLRWVVKRTDTGQSAEFLISAPPAAAAEASDAVVALQSADLSADGATLTLNGIISNPTGKALSIERDNVSLVGGDATYLILASTEFPWAVQPGQSFAFTVTYQRPIGVAQATFTIANQSFQIDGWQ